MHQKYLPMVGDLIKIRDNGKFFTHNTPRWSYGEIGRVIRLNDRTVTVELLTYYPGEKIRVDYDDIQAAENSTTIYTTKRG